ncbi:putative nucleoredoxin 2 isoform X1 [Iris pallida]|uniref:protein-disulfide reductase n=1 Tax=Iris pallida TaxID=29817 RepID=A0AAX6FUB8_IRIPA|nr:putative nucleoredoxin 2 isoform X1 [Iris pallida]
MDTPSGNSLASAAAEGSLSSVLSTENRDFLISPSGVKVFVKDMEDTNTIGLYFGANWYSPCESFTPVLASVYHRLKSEGRKFEVVFVSSDEDQASFDRFRGGMPWPAIPFGDLRSKRSLTRRFQIEGIPSLVILGPDGGLVCSDGVELVYRHGWRAFPFTPGRIAELEAEEEAKHASQTLEDLLLLGSDTGLIRAGQLQVPVSSLVGKTVGLYFSADGCPPCAKFTSRLISIYDSLRGKEEEFEIVFVSVDRDEVGYARCYAGMPWLALPYDGGFSKALSRYFDVQGIPALVIIGPDGKTVTREGRNLINLHLERAFPFTEDRVRLLGERMDEEAKGFPASFNHAGHRHALRLVTEGSGGGPYICCECEEQGLRWAYQCLGCGYEVHLKCVREVVVERDADAAAISSSCAIGSRIGV